MARRHHRGGDLAGTMTDNEFGYYVPRAYWASRLAPYAGEWAAVGAAWLAGEGSHLWLGESPGLPWVTAGMSVLGAGLSALTWRVGKARAPITRAHATATTATGAAWLTAATIAGATTSPLLEMWAFGGAALALSWNIRRALRGGGEDGGGDSLFEKVKLAGVRARDIEVAPNKVTAGLQLPPGEMTAEDVQAVSDKLASALRLPKGSVRINPNPDDLSQATMTVVPQDVLRHPQPWPGPSHPGGSITDPIVTGVYEDNEPMRLWLPGDKATHRNATHVGVQGMNGSGKSHGAKLSWTEILTRRDAGLIVLDPSKGEQTVGFLGEESAHIVTGHQACREFVKRIPAAITAHASQLGRWGFDQWTPEAFDRHGLPYTVIWIEEAARVLEDVATMTRIAQEARSAGISLVLSLQKAVHRQMNTDIRSQLGGVWCFGVKDIEDAAFLLSEDVIDAGARPDRWQNRRPGCSYLEAPGIAEDRFSMPGRTFNSVDAQLAADITAHGHIRPPLHEITAKALGLPRRPGATTTRTEGDPTVPTTNTDPGEHTAPDGFDEFDGPLSDTEDTTPVDWPADPEPDLPGDATTELPTDDPDMPLPRPRPTRTEARKLLLNLIAEHFDAGNTALTVRDLPDPEATFGRGRPWLSGELDRLARDGVLAKTGTSGNATAYTPPIAHAA